MSLDRTSRVTGIGLLRLATLLAATVLAPTVCAGVYDVDSTSTADTLEIKAKFYSTHSSDKQVWRLPGLSASGMINDHTEWSIGSGYGKVRDDEGVTRSGLRDLTVSTKWRFLDHSAQGGVSMSMEPEFAFPIGSESSGVSAGAVAFALPLVVSKRFGPVRVTGQARVERVFGRDDDEVGAGMLTEYAVSDQCSYGIELVADAPRAEIHAYHLRANVGFKWEPNEHFELQALAGRTVKNRDGASASAFRLMFEFRI